MSGYQYYEFQAIDRPLTSKEMADLRTLSTRASITSTRFMNVYNWGDLKGDPLTLMERYFDAFVYVTNWGTHQLMLRLPRGLLDPATIQRYFIPNGRFHEGLTAHGRDEHVILEYISEDEYADSDEGEGWLASLLPLRSDILQGDSRSLYLGWLLAAQTGILQDEEIEPPVPPGLDSLSAPLNALVEFLRIDEDLLAAADSRSAPLQTARPASNELARWIHDLPDSDKNAWLRRLVERNEPHLGLELRQRFQQETTAASGPAAISAGERTVSALIAAAADHREIRERREAEHEARERARREQVAAAEREAYLAGLPGSEDALWQRVEALIESKQSTKYNQAVQLITDLHDLSARSKTTQAFDTRLRQLLSQYGRRPSLRKRLEKAGLPHD